MKRQDARGKVIAVCYAKYACCVESGIIMQTNGVDVLHNWIGRVALGSRLGIYALFVLFMY